MPLPLDKSEHPTLHICYIHVALGHPPPLCCPFMSYVLITCAMQTIRDRTGNRITTRQRYVRVFSRFDWEALRRSLACMLLRLLYFSRSGSYKRAFVTRN